VESLADIRYWTITERARYSISTHFKARKSAYHWPTIVSSNQDLAARGAIQVAVYANPSFSVSIPEESAARL
jgi:hypothetical protein